MTRINGENYTQQLISRPSYFPFPLLKLTVKLLDSWNSKVNSFPSN